MRGRCCHPQAEVFQPQEGCAAGQIISKNNGKLKLPSAPFKVMPAQSPDNLLSFIRKVNVLQIFSNSLLLLPLIVFELPAKADFERCYNSTIHTNNHTFIKLWCQCMTSITNTQVIQDLSNRSKFCLNENWSYSNNSRQWPVQQSPVIIFPGLTDFQGRNERMSRDAYCGFAGTNCGPTLRLR